MIWMLYLLGGLCCLTASGFFSGSEMGLYCLNRLRLQLYVDTTRDPRAALLQHLARDQQRTVLTILLGNNTVNYLLTVAAAGFLASGFGVPGGQTEFYIAAVLSPLVFVFGDVVPKNWYQVQANPLMLRSARLLTLCEVCFKYTGLLLLLQTMTRISARLAGHDDGDEFRNPRAEVAGLLREGGASGGLTEEQTNIIDRVMNLSSVAVGEIMVPAKRVTTVPIDADRGSFERIVRMHTYSRMPARDHAGHIVGVINVHDVLMSPPRTPIADLIQPPLTLLASDSAAAALVRLQQAERSMAIVTDPRRGFVGIVTLKDVIEEIFGELHAW